MVYYRKDETFFLFFPPHLHEGGGGGKGSRVSGGLAQSDIYLFGRYERMKAV